MAVDPWHRYSNDIFQGCKGFKKWRPFSLQGSTESEYTTGYVIIREGWSVISQLSHINAEVGRVTPT